MKQGIVMEKDNNNAIIMTNDGQFLSVPAKSSWQIGETVTVTEFEQKLSRNNNKVFIKKNKRILAAIVATILLFLMPFSLISEASTYVTLDINPSIEFEIKNEKVINMRALNSDGERLITHINNENNLSPKSDSDIYSITSLILIEAEKLGYLKANEENIIMVGVSESKYFKDNEYEQFIQNKLSEINLAGQVIVLNATSNEKKIADEKGISLGRQLLLEKEKDEGILISDEQIANESIKSIFSKIEEDKKKNNLKKQNSDDEISELIKQDSFEDDEKKKENENQSSSTDNNNLQKDNIKQEDKTKQKNEEDKKKAESKEELEKKIQEEQKEKEKKKVEDKEDRTQQEKNNNKDQEEIRKENEQEIQNDKSNRDNKNKEENSNIINEEDKKDKIQKPAD